jgi:outer membrane protein
MRARSAFPRWASVSFSMSILLFICSTIFSPVTIAQQAAPLDNEAATAISSADDDLPPQPLSPIEKAQKDGTALLISLKDLTKLALQNNLDIAIEDTNEELSRQAIIQSQGVYDPSLAARFTFNSNRNPNTNLATKSTTGSFSQRKQANWNFTFTQPVKTGGSLEIGWNSGRSDQVTTFTLFNPQYNASGSISFTQPLWRNFRIDDNRSQIKITNLDLETSDSQFKQRVTETIADIQSRYWDLVSAIRDYEIKRDSVRLAQITLRDNRKKVEVGTLAPIEVTQAEAQAANREVDLISAEDTILNRENALRQLISNDRNAPIWSQVIVPTETPDFREYKVDLDTAILTALNNRPELEQADIGLEQSDIRIKLNQNKRRWQVDLTASLGSVGVAGPQFYQLDPVTGQEVLGPDGNPIPQTPLPLVGGIGTAYKTVFTEGFYNWSVGFNVQVPLRNRAADAQIAREEIDKRRKLMQRKNQEQAIQVEVRNAVQQLETNRKRVETSKVALRLAQEQLDGEVKRFEAGLSENFRVLDQQNALSTAEYQELVSLINYKKSIINLQKAMYTLLEANEFDIAKGSAYSVPDLE